jgi:hypothetical protein
MIRRETLFARRCVTGLVQIIEQAPARVAVRAPVSLDSPTVGRLLLWTILRWERTYLLICLERLGVDMWGLTCDLDALIEAGEAAGPTGGAVVNWSAGQGSSERAWDALLDRWLQLAQQQAGQLNHPFVGAEHLLLAIIAEADPALSELLSQHGLDYERIRAAVLEMLASRPAKPAATVAPVATERRLGPDWDTPAVGVPRRFGLGILFMMTTMYALLFAVLQLLGAPVEVFLVIVVFFTGVGFGQTILYGGQYPRAASIWTGAVLLPLEILALMLVPGARKGSLEEMVSLLVISPLLGAGLGYLAGGLAAGAFVLLKEYQARFRPAATQQGEEEATPD